MFNQSPLIRWRKYNNNYFLEASKCQNCKKIHFPKAYICTCGCSLFDKTILSGAGKIVSFSTVNISTEQFVEQGVLIIALIELCKGVKICGQIVESKIEDLKIGDFVESCFRKISQNGDDGIINYGIKFRVKI